MCNVLWIFVTSVKTNNGDGGRYSVIQNDQEYYLFYDQGKLEENNRCNFKKVIDELNGYICDNKIEQLKILFHDRHLNVNLSNATCEQNPFCQVRDDVDLLCTDYENESKLYAETLGINGIQKHNETLKINDKIISLFYIFRHEKTSICYQFIEDISKIFFKIKFPEDYKKKGDYLKLINEIINLWLPLAIDIQGLHDVDGGNRDAYIKKIKENGYLSSFQEKWEELKNELKNSDIKSIFFNGEGLRFDPVEIVDAISSGQFNDDYIDDQSDHYFPKWLRKVIEEIDKKRGYKIFCVNGYEC